MSEWTIIHNPRWGTSRKALQLLRDNSIEPNIVNYIKGFNSMLVSINEANKSMFLRVEKQKFSNLTSIGPLKDGFRFIKKTKHL